MPTRTRAALLRAELVRRLRPRSGYAVPFGAATISLSHADYAVDWASLAFVAVDEAYAGDYHGAAVVDLGAHKGYFAAYALAHGARVAVSYEPETTNFAFLERAAATIEGGAAEWQTRQRAVGVDSGEAELHVMGASWGHALHPPDAFATHEVGIERVRVDRLADVLAGAVDLAAGARVIVKLNIEGEECPTILGTPTSAWNGVNEVYVETHPWASCGASELTEYFASAGLTPVASAHPLVLRLRRAAARGAPRTDPT